MAERRQPSCRPDHKNSACGDYAKSETADQFATGVLYWLAERLAAYPAMPSHDDRRRFRRVDFFTGAFLCDANGRVPCDVHDVSLHGALVAVPADYRDVSLMTPLTLEIPLDDETAIRMQVEVAHERENVLGLECVNIDVDSITHLRRLVELNLGDSSLLERELPALQP